MAIIHLRQYPEVNSCEGCGACCLEQSAPPGYISYLTGIASLDDGTDDAARVRALPAELRAELERYIALPVSRERPDGEVCLWFDPVARQCKHYDLRPEICREFEMGSDFCHSWRRRYGVEQSTASRE